MRGDFPQLACLRLTSVQYRVLYGYFFIEKKNKKQKKKKKKKKKKNISMNARKIPGSI